MNARVLHWLPLGTFLSAACALSLEIAVVRLGAPRVGQSLLPWTGAIVSVLLGLAIGHLLGGAAGGKQPPAATLRLWLARGWTAASVGAALLPLAVAWLVDTAWWMSAATDIAALAITALAFPASLFAGMALPLALRLALTQASGSAARRVAAVLAASALGSVAGTAATGFWLLETVGAGGVAIGSAIAWATLAALVLPAPGRPFYRLVMLAPALLCLAVASTAQRPWPPCHAETRYTCIRLLDEPIAVGGMLRFMVLDEGVHSASDRDHPRRLHLGYAALVDQLSQPVLAARAAPRALVIGGGGATLPRAWADTYPDIAITVAEIDAAVARTAARELWANQPAITTRVGDGRAVLRALPAAERQDVILLDAYRTRSVPPHLVSIEFARMVHARLTDGGLYLSNVIDSADRMQLTTAVATTLAQVFDRVEVWVPSLGATSSTNAVVAAWRNSPAAAPDRDLTVATTVLGFGGQAQTQDIRWQRWAPEDLRARWTPGCALALTDDHAPVDRLLAGRHHCPP